MGNTSFFIEFPKTFQTPVQKNQNQIESTAEATGGESAGEKTSTGEFKYTLDFSVS
eukprot:TRINITY_DN1233_c0_g1_i3.p1 TRINITY_DN1233_c0_g1~~TRINITY_DN1233_c0_g1_i3.p1  ORF type:complete len:56 (+),score=10.02 TRINITY_DN1233_c0_g1_i3:47-214(+)